MRNKIFKKRKDVTNQQTIENTYSQNCNLNPVTKNKKRKEEIQATTTKLMVLNQLELFAYSWKSQKQKLKADKEMAEDPIKEEMLVGNGNTVCKAREKTLKQKRKKE